MACVVVVGAQWGEEGKGKVVDLYTEVADAVVRFQGAGPGGDESSIAATGEGFSPSILPAGVTRRGKRAVLGPGAVIEPVGLARELGELRARGFAADAQDFVLSDAAHVVLPYHQAVDDVRGQRGQRGVACARGFGPAYEDKVARVGIRVADLYRPGALRFKLQRNIKARNEWLVREGASEVTFDEVWAAAETHAELFAPHVMNVPRLLDELRRRGKHLLFEGEHGVLLDVDHGTYPFVTASSATAGGACTGGGIGPTHITAVVGVCKAYVTRASEGPFPTEERGDLRAHLERAAERGDGAARRTVPRCGWLDVVALRHAARVGGMTGLAVTALDALSGLPKVKLCVAYDLEGERIEELPPDAGELERCVPLYEELDGWSEAAHEARTLDSLPRPARAYLSRLSGLLGLPLTLVSVGAQRTETIVVQNPFR